jgi:hypothetical protein
MQIGQCVNMTGMLANDTNLSLTYANMSDVNVTQEAQLTIPFMTLGSSIDDVLSMYP